jgi:hypothetical protein
MDSTAYFDPLSSPDAGESSSRVTSRSSHQTHSDRRSSSPPRSFYDASSEGVPTRGASPATTGAAQAAEGTPFLIPISSDANHPVLATPDTIKARLFETVGASPARGTAQPASEVYGFGWLWNSPSKDADGFTAQPQTEAAASSSAGPTSTAQAQDKAATTGRYSAAACRRSPFDCRKALGQGRPSRVETAQELSSGDVSTSAGQLAGSGATAQGTVVAADSAPTEKQASKPSSAKDVEAALAQLKERTGPWHSTSAGRLGAMLQKYKSHPQQSDSAAVNGAKSNVASQGAKASLQSPDDVLWLQYVQQVTGASCAQAQRILASLDPPGSAAAQAALERHTSENFKTLAESLGKNAERPVARIQESFSGLWAQVQAAGPGSQEILSTLQFLAQVVDVPAIGQQSPASRPVQSECSGATTPEPLATASPSFDVPNSFSRGSIGAGQSQQCLDKHRPTPQTPQSSPLELPAVGSPASPATPFKFTAGMSTPRKQVRAARALAQPSEKAAPAPPKPTFASAGAASLLRCPELPDLLLQQAAHMQYAAALPGLTLCNALLGPSRPSAPYAAAMVPPEHSKPTIDAMRSCTASSPCVQAGALEARDTSSGHSSNTQDATWSSASCSESDDSGEALPAEGRLAVPMAPLRCTVIAGGKRVGKKGRVRK